MKNTIWIFGCSYSSGFQCIPRTSTYGNLLAEQMGYDVKNLAQAGTSNDIILWHLISNLHLIQPNDIILYQFTAQFRIGMFDEHDDYHSFNGIVEDDIHNPFNKYGKRKLNILMDYITEWKSNRVKFDYDNSLNVLKYLYTTKQVQFVTLYMNNEYVVDDNVLCLPTTMNDKNTCMMDYIEQSHATISDENPNKYDYFDTHPGISGNILIKDLIYNKLTDEKSI
jgi:hypothetical protein